MTAAIGGCHMSYVIGTVHILPQAKQISYDIWRPAQLPSCHQFPTFLQLAHPQWRSAIQHKKARCEIEFVFQSWSKYQPQCLSFLQILQMCEIWINVVKVCQNFQMSYVWYVGLFKYCVCHIYCAQIALVYKQVQKLVFKSDALAVQSWSWQFL